MKKLLFILAICTYIIIPVFGTHTAHAQERREYTLLSPLPYTTTSGGLDNPKGEKTTFSQYLKGTYQLFFGIAGVLAVIMIVAGGFQYATTDAIQNKSEGRDRIKNAILGLLLAFSTYIILYTISPGLLEFNFQVEKPSLSLPPVQTISSSPCEGCVNLTNLGIPIKPGSGTNVQESLATRLAGLNNNLNSTGIPWMVTEGNPPTRNHRDPCHYDGRCVDADIVGEKPTLDQISRFVAAADANNLTAIWETKDADEAAALRSVGINVLLFAEDSETISGSHFSVYPKEYKQ